jgi:hypothetical protein
MKQILLCLLLLTLSTARAQDSLVPQRKSIITLSLFSPVFSYVPRYNVGYMRNVAPRWWVGLEAGYGSYGAVFGSESDGDEYITKEYRSYQLSPEVYFDLRPSSKLKHLVSAELFYINHKDHYLTSRYDGADGIEYTFDAADYKRIKTGLNINYSLMFYFSGRFGLLWKTGFGIAHRDVAYSNVLNKTALPGNSGADEEGSWFGTEEYQDQEGAVTKFNFNTDLKLFYRF